MIYLSIVVPFYNNEGTLRRCLDSIVAQQLPADEVEVVLVNDGSTDGSMKVCEEYADRYPWVRILNTWHQGQGHARNYGMDEAKGKYVMFADADDALSTALVTEHVLDRNARPSALPDGARQETAMHLAYRKYVYREDVDVVKFGDTDNYLCNGHDYLERCGLPMDCVNMWCNREYLKGLNVRFHHYRVAEELVFAAHVLLSNPRLMTLRLHVYDRLPNPKALRATRGKDFAKEWVRSYLKAVGRIANLMEQYAIDYNSAIYNSCIDRLNEIKSEGVRMMPKARYNHKEHRHVRHVSSETYYYPIYPWKDSWRNRLLVGWQNRLIQSFGLYRLVSLF